MRCRNISIFKHFRWFEKKSKTVVSTKSEFLKNQNLIFFDFFLCCEKSSETIVEK